MDENGSKSHLDATAAETTRHIDATTAELLHHIDATFTEMDRHFNETAEGLRQHFDVAMEKPRHEIRLLQERVVSLNQRVDHSTFEMRSGFAETWAVLKSFQRPEDYTE